MIVKRVILITCICVGFIYLMNKIPTSLKKTDVTLSTLEKTNGSNQILPDDEILKEFLDNLPLRQRLWFNFRDSLANSSRDKLKKFNYYKELANFCSDSAGSVLPYLLYQYKIARLSDNKQFIKNISNIFLQNLLVVSQPELQNWFAIKTQNLVELINNNDDSSKITIAACQLLGNLSNQPMTFVAQIQAFAQKNPPNLYAFYVLGVAGKKSKQFSRAIARFLVILPFQTKNVDLKLNIAECYELNMQYDSAVYFYQEAEKLITNINFKKELNLKIKNLRNQFIKP